VATRQQLSEHKNSEALTAQQVGTLKLQLVTRCRTLREELAGAA